MYKKGLVMSSKNIYLCVIYNSQCYIVDCGHPVDDEMYFTQGFFLYLNKNMRHSDFFLLFFFVPSFPYYDDNKGLRTWN